MPAKHSIDELTPLQRTIMELAWERRGITVYDVQGQLASKQDLPYTTILSAMQTLAKTGWLKFRREGRTYTYRAARKREKENCRALDQLIERIFGGDPLLMFQHFLDGRKLSAADMDKLQRLIEERRKD